ncbi:hypothetical protein ACFQI7_31595 [Paenibacillus allorhizosphaerae]|uniref:Uncharacterized protein n=1 Tax=Paenibacillus allorhizosphaerae TaxID=2849866 RepID=A0ABN7TS24_9BACL|nr:hypothetical protein [Paenibacillus allorhizosphaerae]CAG7653542.1 hypothetical protein PAECIP111802_05514 [Paenibacillus allorhizosphaerae]
MQQFEAVLHRPEGTGTWTYFNIRSCKHRTIKRLILLQATAKE